MKNKTKVIDNVQSNIVSDPIECISMEEKMMLDAVKYQKELAVANAKAAIAQSQLADSNHQNVILQLAMKYHLITGDTINDDGTIKRK